MDVETAAPGAADFEPSPSVYARNSDAPGSVQAAFQVGRTAPPRLPLPPMAENDADMMFLNRIPRVLSASHLHYSKSKSSL